MKTLTRFITAALAPVAAASLSRAVDYGPPPISSYSVNTTFTIMNFFDGGIGEIILYALGTGIVLGVLYWAYRIARYHQKNPDAVEPSVHHTNTLP